MARLPETVFWACCLYFIIPIRFPAHCGKISISPFPYCWHGFSQGPQWRDLSVFCLPYNWLSGVFKTVCHAFLCTYVLDQWFLATFESQTSLCFWWDMWSISTKGIHKKVLSGKWKLEHQFREGIVVNTGFFLLWYLTPACICSLSSSWAPLLGLSLKCGFIQRGDHF